MGQEKLRRNKMCEDYYESYEDDYEWEKREARGLTWSEQYMEDNSYEKIEDPDGELDWCEGCNKETEHYFVRGHDGWDSYSYSVCIECGKKMG